MFATNQYKKTDEELEEDVTTAAEATYQRGKMVVGVFKYEKAYEHFERASRYRPEVPEYAEHAAVLATVLDVKTSGGDPSKSVMFFERIDPSHFGSDIDAYVNKLIENVGIGLNDDQQNTLKQSIETAIENNTPATPHKSDPTPATTPAPGQNGG